MKCNYKRNNKDEMANYKLTTTGAFFNEYAKKIDIDKCVSLTDSFLHADFDEFKYRLSCVIFDEIEETIDFTELKRRYKQKFGEETSKEDAEHAIFVFVSLRVISIQKYRRNMINDYFDNIEEKHGNKVEEFLSEMELAAAVTILN